MPHRKFKRKKKTYHYKGTRVTPTKGIFGWYNDIDKNFEKNY